MKLEQQHGGTYINEFVNNPKYQSKTRQLRFQGVTGVEEDCCLYCVQKRLRRAKLYVDDIGQVLPRRYFS